MGLIYAFIASPWWDALTAVAGLAGVLGLVQWKIGRRDGWRGALIKISLGLLAATVVFSMLFEEFLPHMSKMGPRHTVETGLGMALFALGTVIFVIGGRRLIRGLQEVISTPPPKGRNRKTNRIPVRAQLAPGRRLLGLGVLVFILGIILYHETRFPLTFLSAPF